MAVIWAELQPGFLKKRNLFGVKLGERGSQNHFWTAVATAGGLTGLLLTFPAVHVMKANLGQYFRVFPLTRDTLGLGLAVALTVGLLAAVAPAWRAARVSIAAALRKVG